MENLESQLAYFESQLDKFETVNYAVSEGTIGWHISHCTMVCASIINALKASDENTYSKKFSLKKTIVFFTKKIPRGKAKAPSAVQLKDDINKVTIVLGIAKAKEKISQSNLLIENKYFNHPVFGNLNVKNAKKFLLIHNNHHIKIIVDILKN